MALTEVTRILDAIKPLPLSEKFFLIEMVFKNIKEQTVNKERAEEERRKAAELLLADYQEDEALTAFTVLDKKDFYEAK